MPPLISLITCRAELHCFAWSFVSHVDVRWLLVSYQAFVVLRCRCWCVLSWIKPSERFPSSLGSVVTVSSRNLSQVSVSEVTNGWILKQLLYKSVFKELLLARLHKTNNSCKVSRLRARDTNPSKPRTRQDLRHSRPRLEKMGLETETKSWDSITDHDYENIRLRF